jgi:hypothetical protein
MNVKIISGAQNHFLCGIQIISIRIPYQDPSGLDIKDLILDFMKMPRASPSLNKIKKLSTILFTIHNPFFKPPPLGHKFNR